MKAKIWIEVRVYGPWNITAKVTTGLRTSLAKVNVWTYGGRTDYNTRKVKDISTYRETEGAWYGFSRWLEQDAV